MTDLELIQAQNYAADLMKHPALTHVLFRALRQGAFDAFETAIDVDDMQKARSLLDAAGILEMQLTQMANEAKMRTE